ncbi:GtrA family protein [Paenibacillus sp. UNC451MF]|uniref:GtrA family protein n=1 Tax=Paenibacillus sp. UNC451MF TaxID=1449063 RepID=UPI00048D2948|nr:GtrA family protein [Paenibacillus sp. UNC451MF]
MKLSDESVRTIGQLIKFNLVGILNTAVDLCVFLVLYSACEISAYGAHGIAYFAGVLNSYYWNRRWTFRQKAGSGTGRTTFLRFLLLNGVTLGLSTLGLMLLTQYGHLNVLWAKLAVTGGMMVINFCVSRMWVFTKAAERG